MLFVTSLKHPSTHFYTQHNVKFINSRSNTRSSTANKLCYTFSPNNTRWHFYFTCLPRTWNSLSSIKLNLSIANIQKSNQRSFVEPLYLYFWCRESMFFTSVVAVEIVTVMLQIETFKNSNSISHDLLYIQIVNLYFTC